MRRFLSSLFLLFCIFYVNAQSLYTKSFGNEYDESIIFLHGGPGSSSVFFEATTAQRLADLGFHVIVYDRRGEGRSVDKNAKMNFEEAFDDLDGIYKKYNLNKATLIGFSFGGLVTTMYAKNNPQKINSVVLISSLISQQESYNVMIERFKNIYQNTATFDDIIMVTQLDTLSLDYRTLCFDYASKNSFFRLEKPNHLADSLYSTYQVDPLIKNYVRNEKSVETFWKNETLRNIDISDDLRKLKEKKIPVYALYGKQDGLYSGEQISKLRKLIGHKNLKYLDNCSHTLFIDQQSIFLKSMKIWIKKKQGMGSYRILGN